MQILVSIPLVEKAPTPMAAVVAAELQWLDSYFAGGAPFKIDLADLAGLFGFDARDIDRAISDLVDAGMINGHKADGIWRVRVPKKEEDVPYILFPFNAGKRVGDPFATLILSYVWSKHHQLFGSALKPMPIAEWAAIFGRPVGEFEAAVARLEQLGVISRLEEDGKVLLKPTDKAREVMID